MRRVSFFSFFFFIFATFDFTLLINKMLHLKKKNKNPIILKVGIHFGKVLFKINKNIIMSSFKSSKDTQKKKGGPDSCFG